jgi:DNA-binding HxlR family transcriptional regulator
MVGGTIGADGQKAGAHTLGLLATPFATAVLDELARGPRRLAELRRATGSPQTTLRARLGQLGEVGAVAKRRLHPFPSVREHVLINGSGTELRFVAATLADWLARGPGGGLELGGEPARVVVRALSEGWSAGIVRVLAERPASLPDLRLGSEGLSAQSVERRLLALRDATLLEEVDGGPGQVTYAATEWLRQAAAPLAAATRWERKHLPTATPPIGPDEAEAGFLLAAPLLRLPAEASGSCRLGVEFQDGSERRLAGVTVEAERGRIVSCSSRLESNPAAAATGPPAAWLRVTIEAQPDRLELAGDTRLARVLLDALNRTLFPPRLI